MSQHVRVAVIGGGPSGLAAATALTPIVGGEVRVFDREKQAGGIPRHSDHPGYGIRDLHRFLSGPEYAKRLVETAQRSGAVIETEAMVTGWVGERTFEVTSPQGRRAVEADVVVLATGARERPRPARLIPGDRPDGVYTTGQLQNLVHMHHRQVGERAVIIGAELVSWSAAITLREAGCTPMVMTSLYERSEAYAAFRMFGRAVLRVPVSPRTRVVRINGRGRVSSVELEDTRTGTRRVIECDTVVTTGDWIPDNELARAQGIELDPLTRGPVVDGGLATSAPGIFAIGNMVHPVDTADVAALDGEHVVTSVLAWLNREAPRAQGPRLEVDPPLRWVAPQVVNADRLPARGRLLLWADATIRFPTVTVRQGGRVVARKRIPWPCAPGRVFRVPAPVLRDASPEGGPVRISVD
ncbi:NAD(P)/FAD-dependent oxidoreductase [Aeromicrobium sp. CTD01-1L150]|uniref:NAD(P)/FAD-dependent oxidoreductase n=1 Tax=Aeromicrobium sp. CTD01-1L150 TaxID=3341830 RepID=UPI0035C15FB2